jgi:exosortase
MVGLGLVLVAFVGLFWRWFLTQHRYSSEFIQDWGHSYLVPVISGYMVYRAWPWIVRTPAVVFPPGLLAVAAGLASYVFFIMGFGNHMMQGLSMVLVVFGLTLFALGPAQMRHLFLPIAFLVFGITISEQIMIMITFKLQNVSAWGGYYMLALLGPMFGFTVSITGNNIEIVTSKGTTIPLAIAEACSGMRMVVAFIALAGAVALMSCSWWWQRTAVMLLAVPVAVAMNLVRIAVLGLLSLIDPKLASGDAHIFIGTILLVPALMVFMAAVWSLDRIWIPGDGVKPGPTKAVGPIVLADRRTWAGLFGAPMLGSIAILALSAAGLTGAISLSGVVVRPKAIYPENGRALMAVSANALASWEPLGSDTRENAEIEETLGTKNYLTRTYVRRPGKGGGDRPVRLQLHVAYYTGSIDTVPHVPERCMVGAGWQIAADPRIVPLDLDETRWSRDPRDSEAMSLGYMRMRTGDGSDAPGRFVNLPKGIGEVRMQITPFIAPNGMKMHAGYFFIANGQVATTAFDVRRMAFDRKAKYAFYMKVQISSVEVANEKELAAESAALLDELMPELMRCVPDWLRVERGEYPPRRMVKTGWRSGRQRGRRAEDHAERALGEKPDVFKEKCRWRARKSTRSLWRCWWAVWWWWRWAVEGSRTTSYPRTRGVWPRRPRRPWHRRSRRLRRTTPRPPRSSTSGPSDCWRTRSTKSSPTPSF